MPSGAPTPSITPTDEPLTLTEVKLAIRVDTTADDIFIQGAIGTAREMCEEDLGLSLMPQQKELVLDYFPWVNSHPVGHSTWPSSGFASSEICIPRPPLRSVDVVRYFDFLGNELVYDASNYVVDTDSYPGRIVLKLGSWWPSQVQLLAANAVRIRYSCGFRSAADIPHRLKQGMLLIIGSLYRHREANVETTRTSAISALMLDSPTQTAVERLWKRYRTP